MNAGAEGLLLEAANSFILTVGEGRSRIPSPRCLSLPDPRSAYPCLAAVWFCSRRVGAGPGH